MSSAARGVVDDQERGPVGGRPMPPKELLERLGLARLGAMHELGVGAGMRARSHGAPRLADRRQTPTMPSLFQSRLRDLAAGARDAGQHHLLRCTTRARADLRAVTSRPRARARARAAAPEAPRAARTRGGMPSAGRAAPRRTASRRPEPRRARPSRRRAVRREPRGPPRRGHPRPRGDRGPARPRAARRRARARPSGPARAASERDRPGVRRGGPARSYPGTRRLALLGPRGHRPPAARRTTRPERGLQTSRRSRCSKSRPSSSAPTRFRAGARCRETNVVRPAALTSRMDPRLGWRPYLIVASQMRPGVAEAR